jgi:hypothetical protein
MGILGDTGGRGTVDVVDFMDMVDPRTRQAAMAWQTIWTDIRLLEGEGISWGVGIMRRDNGHGMTWVYYNRFWGGGG